ncbi:MAG TPA: Gfo/Idh/MocA family oxidoreductase [Vicinamibacterales bacterium]|nr:Gfo/Idh/MocA family oxidoreductase [Vicinamibacterales bacterium]
MTIPDTDPVSRRAFLGTTAAAAAALAMPGGLFAQGSDRLRLGLVGCGGRGTGAARDALRASPGVELVAMGDLLPERLAQSRGELAKAAAENADIAAGYRVTDDRCFTGFDAYARVLASDIDLVILATPPGFRPAHLAAAVAAGKHIFAEKPVAVDPAGVRSVLETYERARQRGLGIGVGTQRRHEAPYLETIRRIHDGAIGDVLTGQVFWNQGGLWSREHREGWSDGEWQIRNWLYFAWLSGDHIVEQHVHNIDVANWVLGAHPVRAVGVGGRQSRVEPRYGHIYDHFAVDFEYASGARVVSMCRQIQGTRSRIGEHFIGTRGRSNAAGSIAGASAWTFEAATRPVPSMVQEHTDLVASIRAGAPINELKQIAESTLTAIMGREAAYTGQELTWDEVLNADQALAPPDVGFVPMDVPPVAMPGRTKLTRTWNEG